MRSTAQPAAAISSRRLSSSAPIAPSSNPGPQYAWRHRAATRAALRMPHRPCGAQRAAGIPRGGLHVDLAEGRHQRDLAVGHRVVAAAPGDRDAVEVVSLVQGIEQMEEGLLVHRLQRAREVLVPLLQRLVAPARRPEQIRERRRIERPDRGRAVVPLVLDLLAVMPEAVEVQPKAPALLQRHDLAHRVEIRRLAVRRQSHHLVFVAVVRKAEELRDRLVEDAERVRKIDALLDLDRGAAAHAPRRAGEVAEAVDGNDHRLRERRPVKGGRQMREVVLHRMRLAPERLSRKRARQVRFDAFALALVADAIQHQAEIRALRQHVGELLPQVGLRILVDGHVLDLRQSDPGLGEAVADGLARKARPVLDAAEALLLGRRDDLAIADEAGGGIAVERVDAEDRGHPTPFACAAGMETDQPVSRQRPVRPRPGLVRGTHHEVLLRRRSCRFTSTML